MFKSLRRYPLVRNSQGNIVASRTENKREKKCLKRRRAIVDDIETRLAAESVDFFETDSDGGSSVKTFVNSMLVLDGKARKCCNSKISLKKTEE